MAASAATAYDQAQDAGGSESSDLELDDAPDQLLSQLPNSDDFGAALGQRGTVLRAHPLHEKLSFPANRDTNPMPLHDTFYPLTVRG